MSNKINKTVVTKEGLLELEKEHDNLVHVVRKEVKEELQAAREQGDLSENADYDAARDRQAKVESRIRELEAMLANIEIIDSKPKKGTRVSLGSTVRLLFMDTNEEATYSIVGSVEADPLNGKLSNVAPLCLAIMDKKANDLVLVRANQSYQVKILEVQ